MRIRVVPQIFYRQYCLPDSTRPVYEDPESPFWKEKNFITIRHSAEKDPFCAIPVEGENILRLRFDDVTEDPDGTLILFDQTMAGQIRDFIAKIDPEKDLFINCAAGVSRSGAVGDVLNDYFNKFLGFNALDDYYFKQYNRQIQPNPLVRRILHNELFKNDR